MCYILTDHVHNVLSRLKDLLWTGPELFMEGMKMSQCCQFKLIDLGLQFIYSLFLSILK